MNIRPYVVCHVFAGLNGRIDGAYMLDPAASPARAAYSRMQVEFGADAVAYGAVTMKGFVGSRPLALDTHGSAPKGDFVAPHDERSFYVSVDPPGRLHGSLRPIVAPAVRTRTSSRSSPRRHRRRIATICESAASHTCLPARAG